MPFRDGYPTDIEFEIDRRALLRYSRVQSLIACCAASLPVSILVAVACFKTHREANPTMAMVSSFGWLMLYAGAGVLAGLFVGGGIYFLLSHASSKLASQNLRLMVEGPYLRIISGGVFVTDRRLHFRDIGDYTIAEGPLLRMFGLKALSFRVTSTGRTGQFPAYTVVGLVNPDRVRDQLCDIDAVRELP
jgi:membrane protein YdbS with pleckstrin-like domain